MDKSLKKEIKETSRQFNGLWARHLKFGPEDKEQLLKEAASDLMKALDKFVGKNDEDNGEVGVTHT